MFKLVDIVRFDLLHIVVGLTVLKCVLLERDFHTIIRNYSFVSNQYEISPLEFKFRLKLQKFQTIGQSFQSFRDGFST